MASSTINAKVFSLCFIRPTTKSFDSRRRERIFWVPRKDYVRIRSDLCTEINFVYTGWVCWSHCLQLAKLQKCPRPLASPLSFSSWAHTPSDNMKCKGFPVILSCGALACDDVA